MKRVICFLLGFLAVGLTTNLPAEELEYYKLYQPKPGMSAEEIMQIAYHVKYTLFARDASTTGYIYLVEKNGFKLSRSTARERMIYGGKEGLRYKDLVSFTSPSSVKGFATLSWTYEDPNQDQDIWLWLPSLRKVRKVSASQADDSFMGSDFTVDDLSTRRFEDENYKLLGEEKFKGFTSKLDKKTYYSEGRDCYKIEASPKKEKWYYSKRIVWVDKEIGGEIYAEYYDPNGKLFKHIFIHYKLYDVNGKQYPAQDYLEVEDLKTGHFTVSVNDNFIFDQGLSANSFSAQTLERTTW
jgi:hypothetical protein